MALYFTVYLECYREEDAECLRAWQTPFQIAYQSVTDARVCIEALNGFWYAYTNPQGPGYSPFGYREGMNEPAAVSAIIESLFNTIASKPGIRRAMAVMKPKILLMTPIDPSTRLPLISKI